MSERTRTPACAAPFTSMYLDPRGEVRACCQNQYHRLGNISEASLGDIWNGPRAEELRDRIGHGELTLGCELCAAADEDGTPELAYRRVFSGLSDRIGHRWPARLELALSNACNLQCVMCNGELSSSIRSRREHRPPLPTVYDDAFFAELDRFLPHLDEVTFLGGEPFLGSEPLRVMERLVELGLRPRCHVTTNGTQWSPRVRRIVERLPMHLAVSIDALDPDLLESTRIGVDRDDLVSNIRAIVDEPPSLGVSLAFCLMRHNHRELLPVLQFADDLGVDVFLNIVGYPPRFSVAHASDSEIREITAGFEMDLAGAGTSLRRNRSTLTHALQLVRARLVQATPVSLTAVPSRRDVLAHRIARASSDDRGVDVITIGTDQLIRSMTQRGGTGIGLDADGFIGRPASDVVEMIQQRFGRAVETRLVRHPHGIEERRMGFVADHGVRTDIVAVLCPTIDGSEQWFVGASEQAID